MPSDLLSRPFIVNGETEEVDHNALLGAILEGAEDARAKELQDRAFPA